MNLRFWLCVGLAAVAVACTHRDPTARPIRLASDELACAETGVHTRPATCEIHTTSTASQEPVIR
jgi:hypothetical protein